MHITVLSHRYTHCHSPHIRFTYVSIFHLQSGSGPSPSDTRAPSLPAVPEGAMGDNEEYQEITDGELIIKAVTCTIVYREKGREWGEQGERGNDQETEGGGGMKRRRGKKRERKRERHRQRERERERERGGGLCAYI